MIPHVTNLFRTAPFKLIDPATKAKIISELHAMKNSISWNNLGSARSIQNGIKEMKENKDIGWQQTYNLMPRSDDFHHWMHFCYYLTVIYNRDLEPKRYSIIRK